MRGAASRTILACQEELQVCLSRRKSQGCWAARTKKDAAQSHACAENGLGVVYGVYGSDFLVTSSEVQPMLASEHTGVMAQDWTAERTQYLGAIIQTMLRSYTDTAVNLTTGLLAFISRFALQVLALGPYHPPCRCPKAQAAPHHLGWQQSSALSAEAAALHLIKRTTQHPACCCCCCCC